MNTLAARIPQSEGQTFGLVLGDWPAGTSTTITQLIQSVFNLRTEAGRQRRDTDEPFFFSPQAREFESLVRKGEVEIGEAWSELSLEQETFASEEEINFRIQPNVSFMVKARITSVERAEPRIIIDELLCD
jgi:hypothetical protein